MTEHDFLVTLPSNSNLRTHPKNEPADYTVKLATPLNLVGDWEVALLSLQYTPTWVNIPNQIEMWIICAPANCDPLKVQTEYMPIIDLTYSHRGFIRHNRDNVGDLLKYLPDGALIKRQTLIPRHYENPEMLGKEICRLFNEACAQEKMTLIYRFNPVTRQGDFKVFGGYARIFAEGFPHLSAMLGTETWTSLDSVNPTVDHYHKYRALLSMEPLASFNTIVSSEPYSKIPCIGNCLESPHIYEIEKWGRTPSTISRVHSLWVYTNISEYQQVGDTKAPLLGIIPANGVVGQRTHYTLNPVSFLALNSNYIPEIQIRIVDDTGKRIPFSKSLNDDNVVCCLRFRRRKNTPPI